jgi:hypothetical protein
LGFENGFFAELVVNEVEVCIQDSHQNRVLLYFFSYVKPSFRADDDEKPRDLLRNPTRD